MSLNRGRKFKNFTAAFLICGAFLFTLAAKNAVAAFATSTYEKPFNGTLTASEWNDLFKDFANTWTPTSLAGPVGIATSSPADNGVWLDVNGAVRATSFIGPMSGLVPATNVTPGEFGFYGYGGNYSFGVTNPGNVGIGTSTPTERLEINGKLKIGSNTVSGENVTFNGDTAPGMRIQNAYGYISITPLSSSWAHIYTDRSRFIFDKPVYSFGGTFSAYSTNDLQLQTNGLTRIFVKQTDGSVGIGTSTPEATLDVNGLIKMRSATITANEDVINKGYLDSAIQLASSSIMSQVATSSFWQGSLFGNVWNANTGNIGIGTTNPTYALDITAAGTSYLNINGNGVAPANGYFRISNSTGTIGAMAPIFNGKSNGASYPGLWFLGDTTTDTGTDPIVLFQARQNNGVVANRTLFAFDNFSNSSGGTRVMVINKSGNVGIGITNPTSKLTVVGSDTWTTNGWKKAIELPDNSALKLGSSGTRFGQAVTGGKKYDFYTTTDISTGDSAHYYSIVDTTGNISLGNVNNSVYISSFGNIGIGTTLPNDIFSIGNAGSAPAGSGNTGHNFTNTYLASDDYALANYGLVKTMIGTATSGAALWGGSTSGNIWNLNLANNVGIGTTNPIVKLDVSGSSTAGFIKTVIRNVDVTDPLSGAGITFIPTTAGWGPAIYTDRGAKGVSGGLYFGTTDALGGTSFDADKIRMVINNQGNVGIGTTAVGAYRLSVTGNSYFSGTVGVVNTQIGSNYVEGLSAVSGLTIKASNAAGFLSFQTGGTSDRMRIDSTGNVGIGTTAPNDIFSIGNAGSAPAGSGNTGHNFTNTYLASDDYALANYGLVKTMIGSATSTVASTSLWNGTKNGNIWNGDSGAGNVGIGLTNPDSPLHIIGSAQPLLHIQNSNGNNGITAGILFGVTGAIGDYQQAGIFFERLGGAAEGSLHFATKNGGTGNATKADARMTITAGGNIGIGTTTPGAKLDITSTGSNNLRLTYDSSNYVKLYSSSSGYFHAEPTSGIMYMMKPGGGTASIYVGGDGTTHNRTQYSGNGISIQDTSYVAKTWITGVGNSYFNGGNVGIGTTAPNDALSIGNAGSAPAGSDNTGHNFTNTYLASDDYALANYGLVKTMIGTATSGAALWGGTTGGNIWNLNLANNVGIGITNPTNTLHVVGTGRFTSNVYINAGAMLQTNSIMAISGNNPSLAQDISVSGTDAIDHSIISRIDGNDILNVTATGDGAGGITNKRVTTTGNVGIGTTNPVYPLTVVNTSTSSDNTLALYSTGGATRSTNINFNSIGGNGLFQLDFAGNMVFRTSQGGLYFDNNGTGNTYFRTTSGQTPRMTILNNGNVGIGTTAPNDTLSIGNAGSAPAGSGNTGHNFTNTYLASDDYALANYGLVKTMIGSATSTVASTSLWNGTKNGNIYNGDAGAGNVGIGTTAPTNTLSIGGANTGLRIDNADSGLGQGGNGIKLVSTTVGKGVGVSMSNALMTPANGWQFFAKGGITDFVIGRASLRDNMILSGSQASVFYPGPNAGSSFVAGNYTLMASAGTDATYVPIIARGNVSQTASLQEWQNSAGTALTVIDKNGNVGIGTTTPWSKLDVAGNMRIAGVGSGLFFDTTSGDHSNYIATTNNYWLSFINARGSASRMDLATNDIRFTFGSDTGSVIIKSNGNVGIGTTVPNDALSIGNAGSAPAGSGNTGHNFTNTYLASDDYALANYGLVKTMIGSATSTVASTSLWNGTKNGNIYNGDAGAGNVGIGTTTPAFKLEVVGTVNLPTNNAVKFNNTNNNNPWYIWNNGTNAASLAFGIGVVNNTNNKIIFDGAGNVGIGATAPGARLSVQDASNQGLAPSTGSPTIFTDAGSNYYAAEYKGNGAYTGFYVVNSKAGGTGIPYVQYWNTVNSKQWTTQLETDNSFSVREGNAGGTIRMTYAVGGNVGIGTTTPNSLLHLYSSAPKLILQSSGGAGAYSAETVVNYNAADAFNLQFNYVSAQPFLQFDYPQGANRTTLGVAGGSTILNGNVGIGTTAPNDTLSIGNAGSAPAGSSNTGHNFTNTYLASDDYALANYGLVKTMIGSATSTVASTSLWNGTKNGNIWNGDAGVGNVGIGTSTPGGKFHVATTGDNNSLVVNGTSGNVLLGTTTDVTAFGGAKLQVRGGASAVSTWSGRIIAGGNSSVFLMGEIDNRAVLAGHNSALSAWNDLYINPVSNANTYIGNSGTWPTVKGNTTLSVVGANVGIGTTNPVQKLEINGDGARLRLSTLSSPATYYFDIQSNYSASDTVNFYGVGGNNILKWIYNTNSLLLQPAGGKVGIGTTAPNDIFSIGNAGSAPAGSSNTGHNFTSTYLSSDNFALANYGLVKTMIGDATSSSALWGGATGGAVWNLNSGNVGIGTSTPGELLDVAGTVQALSFNGPLNGAVGANNVTAGVFGESYMGGTYSFGGLPTLLDGGSTNNIYYASTGSHTIQAPQLFVRQDDAESSILNTKVALDIHNDNGGQNTYSTLAFSSREASGAGNPVALAGISGWKISAGTANAWSQGGLKFWVKDNGTLNEAMTINQVGNVGIGTSNPASLLDLELNQNDRTLVRAGNSNSGSVAEAGIAMYSNVAHSFIALLSSGHSTAYNQVPNSLQFINYNGAGFNFLSNSNNPILRLEDGGNVGIGTTNPGAFKLKVAGDVAITGALLTQTGSDFAEEFKAPTALEAGTVVVMGDEGYKSVKACENSYDKTVVGIVSDNPSIIAGRTDIDNKNPEKVIVAMMGVVKVKVTDTNGKITKGDLLTTSDLKGYAMRAKNNKQGTVIGKALEDLNTKTGEIKVLVNLQ